MIEMSVSYIPNKTKLILWGKAAGRCQYKGCNIKLHEDILTKKGLNKAYIAHIVADSPNGPRGNAVDSPLLKEELSNLMLLCDTHHRLIDKEDVEGHPRELLEVMKEFHEAEMDRLTSIMPQMRSHLILYGANIGSSQSPLSYKTASLAMKALGKYPASSQPIKLGMTNSVREDDELSYWENEIHQLEVKFNTDVRVHINNPDVQHFSVFSLAPQPLLIRLGTLLSDINQVHVYQKHRVPDTWEWQENHDEFEYNLIEPDDKGSAPALVLSLSADINDERITSVLENVSIWKVTIDNPSQEIIKTKEHIEKFELFMRYVFNRIKKIHGEGIELHVFPAMPVSCAVTLGRVWMPKADLPLKIYDQNNKNNGFTHAITINHE